MLLWAQQDGQMVCRQRQSTTTMVIVVKDSSKHELSRGLVVLVSERETQHLQEG